MAIVSDSQLAILRYSGELGTKARATRYQFRRRLIRNLTDALTSEGCEPKIRSSRDRIFVELPPGASAEALARVFGVQSLSLAQRRSAPDLAALVRHGAELFREQVRGRTFAVRARRVGNRRPGDLRSMDVMRELGTALLPESAGVHLDAPEVTVNLELVENEVFFFAKTIPAQGGLPLGVEGRAVALISGGFDSAVAAWQLLRRGVCLDYVFCNLGGSTHRQGTLRVTKVLADRWSYGDRPRFHTVDFGPVVEELRAHTLPRFWQVLLKRLMLRSAEHIATRRRAAAIVTGESIGQVSSQTLQNLAVISAATDTPILRPLVGFNKNEIIALAERIGTFELSKVVGEYCDIVPGKPATAASARAIAAEEAKLDPTLFERCLAQVPVIDLRDTDVDQLAIPGLEIDSVPAGATVIDLRSKREFAQWHHPEALWLDFSEAMRGYSNFDRGGRYVLYCEFGLKSAHLAEIMRKEGFDVSNFRGGTRALRRREGRRQPDGASS